MFWLPCFQKYFNLVLFPFSYGEAYLCAIPKVHLPKSIKEYTPIILLCVIRKLMDGYILKVTFIKIPKNQFEFQKHTSIHDAVSYLLNNSMSKSNPLVKHCNYLFVGNVSKAYDSFDRHALLSLFGIISRYLARVVLLLLICTVNILMLLGALSLPIATTSGIPQGRQSLQYYSAFFF